jgi:hypothetical protein
MANIDDELDSDETDTVPDAGPAATPPPKLTPDQAQALLANDLAANADKGAAAQTPYGLQALTDMLGAKTNLDKVAAGAPLPDPNMVIGPAKRLTPLPAGGGAHAAMVPAAAAAPAPAGNAVDAALAPEAQEVKDYEAKQAISGVRDPAVDAKRAADAAQDRQEQEIQDAIAESRAGRQQNFGQAFLTALADPSGKLRQQQLEQADMPLKDLLQKRQMLAQVRDERVKREGEQRQRDMFDPNSEVSKQSAMIYKAMTGKDAPKGYVAAAHGQIKELSEMTAKQREDEMKRLHEQNEDRETSLHNRATERNASYLAHEAHLDRLAALAEKAAKGVGGGKIPEQMVPKVAALAEAPDIYNQLEKAQKDIGLSQVTSFLPQQWQMGAQRHYSNLASANAGAGSLATYPGAKSENADLMKAFQEAIPRGTASPEEAHAIFQTLRNRANQQFENTADTLRAGGTKESEIDRLRQEHQAAVMRNPAGAATGGAKAVTRTVGGVTKQWNGSQWVPV